MIRLPDPRALRRWSALRSTRSRALVLLAVVAGWAIVYAATAPADAGRVVPAVQGRDAAVRLDPGGGVPARAGREASSATALGLRPEPMRELPLERDAGPGSVAAWRLVAGALFLALVLAASAAMLLRGGVVRLGRPGAGAAGPQRGLARWLAPVVARRAVRVVQSSRLTGRASVHVLEWDGKELLVGCTDHGVTVLGERPASEDGRGGATGGGGPEVVPASQARRGAP